MQITDEQILTALQWVVGVLSAGAAFALRAIFTNRAAIEKLATEAKHREELRKTTDNSLLRISEKIDLLTATLTQLLVTTERLSTNVQHLQDKDNNTNG